MGLGRQGQLAAAGGHRGISGRVWVPTSNPCREEVTTMTDDRIAFCQLVEKVTAADSLHEVIGSAASA
jgi:hypothetical protein